MRTTAAEPEWSGSSTLDCVTEAMDLKKTPTALAGPLIRVPEMRAGGAASAEGTSYGEW